MLVGDKILGSPCCRFTLKGIIFAADLQGIISGDLPPRFVLVDGDR